MTFDRLRSIICDQLAADEDEVSLSSNFSKELYADSLDMVDIAGLAEEEFDIHIPDSALKTMVTVGDMVAYIDAHR